MNASPTSPCEKRPASPDGNGGEGSTRCDGCKSCGAILELDGCGHRFHPRCIFTWPISQCEICAAPVAVVKIFREYKNAQNSMVRKGKWSADEHKYANMMMKQFQLGALPLVDGLHLRGFISSLLQCDPLRVTKKYSGHAIGKQNFFYQYRKNYCYNLHIKLQKRVSSLRNHFYWHIQYRCKFGHSINIQELKAAESDYWIREFLRFADKIGQRVEFSAHPMPASPAPGPRPVIQQQQEEQKQPATVEVAAPESAPVTPVMQPLDEVKVEIAAHEPEEQEEKAPVVVVDTMAPTSNKYSQSSADLADGALSPLSFDEWNDATPAFGAVLDGMVFEDFSQGDSTMSPIPPSKVAANARCSLTDWLQEEESRWNETMAVPSCARRLAFFQRVAFLVLRPLIKRVPSGAKGREQTTDTNESQWHTKSSVQRGGCDDTAQSRHVGRQLRLTSVYNSFVQATEHAPTSLSPNVALAGKSSSSSPAALNAYLTKYHQSGPSGQPRRLVDGARSTGRQHGHFVPDRQVLSTFLPREQTARALPESPLSRFKKQAARVAWKTADSRENGTENSDLCNIPTGDHHHQRSPVANPEPKSSLNGTHIPDDRVSSKNEEDLSLKLLTSTSARAVLDRIREAKLLGGQPTKKTFATLSKIACSQQLELLDMENQQGSEVTKKSADGKLGGDASNKAVDRGPEESLGDSQVEVLPVPPPPVSITPRLPAASQQPLPNIQAKPLIPSELPPELSSPDKREQPRRPKNKKKAVNVSVETILKVTKAALLIQRAWKKQRQERQQQQHSTMIHGSDACSRGDDNEATCTTVPLGQSESHPPAFDLPRPPQIMLPQVNPNKAKRAKELSVDTFTAHSAIGMAGQDAEDTSGTDQPTPITEAAPHESIEALWAEDEWVWLEEGGYLGALEDAFGCQGPLLKKQNEDNLLIWRHPQRLIERRESERIAWWQQHKGDKSTVKMVLSNSGHCEELHAERTSSSTTNTESKEARESPSPSKVGNSVSLIASPE